MWCAERVEQRLQTVIDVPASNNNLARLGWAQHQHVQFRAETQWLAYEGREDVTVGLYERSGRLSSQKFKGRHFTLVLVTERPKQAARLASICEGLVRPQFFELWLKVFPNRLFRAGATVRDQRTFVVEGESHIASFASR